ncbi:Post-Gpi Attachment To Proteins Factor 6 [Manis pentadactyla]|nr:Post-Gpi Attachment To Proteins Factor 6 [Manis pentadactyla]
MQRDHLISPAYAGLSAQGGQRPARLTPKRPLLREVDNRSYGAVQGLISDDTEFADQMGSNLEGSCFIKERERENESKNESESNSKRVRGSFPCQPDPMTVTETG